MYLLNMFKIIYRRYMTTPKKLPCCFLNIINYETLYCLLDVICLQSSRYIIIVLFYYLRIVCVKTDRSIVIIISYTQHITYFIFR